MQQLTFMVVAAGNLVSSVTCAIHVQWGLNLVSAGTNGVSGSQANIFEASFVSSWEEVAL